VVAYNALIRFVQVDDLGAERLTDWATEVLFRIFNARYTTRAHTLVVSNVRPDDIPEPRLRSRFLDGGLCQVVPNGADDHRKCKSRSKMAKRSPWPDSLLNYATLPATDGYQPKVGVQ